MRVPGAAGMQEALVTKPGLAESPPSPRILEKLSGPGVAQKPMPTPVFVNHTTKATVPTTHTWQFVHFFYY